MKTKMMMGTLMVVLFATSGCLEMETAHQQEVSDDCTSQGCSGDAQCVDCSGVFMCLEDIGLCPEPLPCPDADDPRVTYLDESLCAETPVRFICGDEEESFDDDCGCGCIAPLEPLECPDEADARVTYLDESLCAETPVRFICGDEEESFDDDCGCGCIAPQKPVDARPALESLTRIGGCGDVHLHARNEEDTLALIFQYGEVIEAAHRAGEPQTHTIDLSAERGALELFEGNHFDTYACSDIVVPGEEVVIDRTYSAVSGTATLVVTPIGSSCISYDCPTQADLTLRDVTLRDEVSGAEIAIEMFELSAFVGWFPG